MLNRRYLRIKAMQALYAFFQLGDEDMPRAERELMRSIDKTYELYLFILLFFDELGRRAGTRIEDNRNKFLPTSEDLDPNLRFVNNRLIKQLAADPRLKREAEVRKLNWQSDAELDLIRNVWNKVRAWDAYKIYMSAETDSFVQDREFVIDLFRKYMADDEDFELYIEERNMHWPGDMNMAVAPAIIKTLESFGENQSLELMPLFKDADDDKRFVVDLFRKTIVNNEENEKRISEKTTNWEVDRIAAMDVLLMKMAQTELIHFSSIPVKVTLNEYIEISKTYSTPKSRQFINGILDKIVIDFKKDGTMTKTGRGLME